ncbi:hypothetical protein D1BOALGB6SA_2888 [Olavius sp. associated proteobacterium Delta 1]|nr:hypothetical protein D1BOALGB6SA_2888 [Olavius sp. associated proteobacterium Delta 1]
MKNYAKRTLWIVFCVFTGSALFFACAQTAGQADKSAPGSKLERYADKAIGFSIEYDAEKLTKNPGLAGPFVFRRQSAEGMPVLGITAGPYPAGTTLEDTADLISSSLPRMIPGSIIHQVNNQQLIKLTDGTAANYFEIEWNVGGMELIAAFVAAKMNDRLIVSGASDSQDRPMENLTAMVKSLRLDVEVDKAALEAKGFARDGNFVRTDSPAFTIEYPKEFQNRVLQANQIFRAGIPRGSPSMSIAISSLAPGEDVTKQLKALAEGYADALKYVGSDIKIISQNPIKKYEGFDAYQIQIVWRYRGQTTLTTVVDIIAKEDQAILLAGHTIYGIDELMDIFKTINLNP